MAIPHLLSHRTSSTENPNEPSVAILEETRKTAIIITNVGNDDDQKPSEKSTYLSFRTPGTEASKWSTSISSTFGTQEE